MLFACIVIRARGQEQPRVETTPADSLPAHISRLTSFGERADWSHDGRFIAFQMARLGDPAGVGRGIFVYDVAKAAATAKR